MNEIKKSEPAFPEFHNPKDLPFVSIQYRGQLSHLYKDDGTYFVTFRLRDAVIENLSNNKKPKDQKYLQPDEICQLSEPLLQKGKCILKDKSIAEIVQNALLFFHAKRYYLYAWCIMPNHVHAVLAPNKKYTLSKILHSWKSFTAQEINKLLGYTGELWEKESLIILFVIKNISNGLYTIQKIIQ